MKNILKNKRKNYFIIDNDYVKLYARHLGTVTTAVYTSLQMFADHLTRRSWPSMETIAEQHGLERHAVSRALTKLEEYNIIRTERAIDRKKRKRKNNVYTLLAKEYWKKIPDMEINPVITHGIESTIPMVSKVPLNGIESTSINTYITTPIEQDPNCGQEPTVSVIENTDKNSDGKSLTPIEVVKPELSIWDCRQAISNLVNSDYREYKIIGCYFEIKKWSFENEYIFDLAVERELKPANLLKGYNLTHIKNTMAWCVASYSSTPWTIETVIKRIDDCIASDFQIQQQKKVIAEFKAQGTPYTPGKYKYDKSIEIYNSF